MSAAQPHRASVSSAEPAVGSSFYAGMRILPPEQRDAMFQVYAFCRAVDDIADSSAPRPIRLSQLSEWRDEINDLYEGRIGGKVEHLAETVRRFDLGRDDFLAVIDGMEMDAREDIRAPDMTTLDVYCDRVASAVGRLSVRIFGLSRADGIQLSHHLGRALQLTNILRDIDEDAEIGRLYLPREALQQAGIDSIDPKTALAHPNLGQVCAPLIELARQHFTEADRIMARAPRRLVKAPRIMGAVYRAMLEAMTRRGWTPPRHRLHHSRLRLAGILLRYAIV